MIGISFEINVVDVNDMEIRSLTPSLLSTLGGETITFTGVELGPLDDARFDETSVRAFYIGPDGVKYYAKDCVVLTRNTHIVCSSVRGVGVDHRWNITVSTPGTSDWSVLTGTDPSIATTSSYLPPTIATVVGAEAMPTGGGNLVTITGTHFGPLFNPCSSHCFDNSASPQACGNSCIGAEEACVNPAGTSKCDEFPGWYVRSVAEVTYGPSVEEIGKYYCGEAKVVEGEEGGGVESEKITCTSAQGVGRGFFWRCASDASEP